MKSPFLQVFGLLCLLVSHSLFAQNYYWVGGSGNWNDATHWATATGGSTKHALPPTLANDVFFDANSFTAAGQSVTITSGATCRSMDWTGVTNAPAISSFFEDVNVYGSLIIPASVQRNFTGNIHLMAASGSYTIDLDNLPLSTVNNETLYFDGSGTWTLQDNISVYNIVVNAGTINTNGRTVTCSTFRVAGTSTKTINLGSSSINCATWNIPSATTNLTLAPGTSTITATFRVTGKGYTYNNLVINGTVEVYDNNTWNILTLNAGSVLKLKEGSTQTITNLISNGTSVNPITIQSVTAGASATLSSAGAITISNANIKDNTATGGPFTANSSTNLGNVTGWTIPVTEPATQASSAEILGATTSEIILRWTNGSGTNRIVLAKAGAAVDATPVDGTSYSAGAFGATVIGSSNYVVYAGNSNQAMITGLTAGTTYHFAVFEFNGTGAVTNYRVISPARVSEPTLASTAIVMSDNDYTRCSGKLYSSRGIWNYGSNENYTQTLTPAIAGNKIQLTFVDFSLGTGDMLKIYDGADTNAPLIGSYTGSNSPTEVSATNSSGLLTLQFTSDGFLQGNFEADIECISATPASEPTVNASNLVFSAVTPTSMTLTWTNGNGAKRIVVAKQTSNNGSSPWDGDSYPANSSFGSGVGGPLEYEVYNGSGNTVTVTNLTPGVSYDFSIYEYNGSGASSNYLISFPLRGTKATSAVTLATEPTVATTGFTFSNVTTSSMTLSWINGNGAKRIVYAFEGTNYGVPRDGNEYTPNTIFGAGAILSGRGYAVYAGSGTSVTITGLRPETFYTFAVFEYNGSGTTTNYGGVTTTYGITLALEPTIQASNVITSSIGTNSFTTNVTRGNGSTLIVVAKQGSAVDVFPVDGTEYTYSGSFSTAQDIGGGNKIVYMGTSSQFPVLGLTASTTYHLAFFEYNGFGTAKNYLTSNPATATIVTMMPPVAPSNLTANALSSSSISLSWTDNSSNEDGFRIYRSTPDNSSYIVVSTLAANTTSYTNTSLAASTTYFYKVQAFNGAGSAFSNETSKATLQLPPTITSLSTGSAGSNATVTITGTNLDGATVVTFGGINASSFTVVSSTRITAVVASGASGSVSVTTPGGTATKAGFTFVPAPTISSFTPTSVASGATVTITGTNLTEATAVSFGGTAASSFTVVSATSITAVVASGTSGSVSVTTLGGTATKTGFTFIPTPTISFFTPLRVASGATVTITGTNLTGATAVSFGGTAASSFAVVSPTSITAVVGSGTSGSISVTTPEGTATKAGFTFIPGLTISISSFTPTSAASGATVTITGTNLTGATGVSFGGTAASSFTVVSPTSITAVVGSGTSGSVSVATPNGSGTLGGFTFIPGVITAVEVANNGLGVDVNVFPNPTSGADINLEFDQSWEDKVATVSIVNISGHVVQTSSITCKSGTKLSIKNGRLSSGLYILTLQSGQKNARIRLNVIE